VRRSTPAARPAALLQHPAVEEEKEEEASAGEEASVAA